MARYATKEKQIEEEDKEKTKREKSSHGKKKKEEEEKAKSREGTKENRGTAPGQKQSMATGTRACTNRRVRMPSLVTIVRTSGLAERVRVLCLPPAPSCVVPSPE